MRADSFRFATSVVFDEECTTDQAREILLRMDVVQHVHVLRGIIFVDDLTPTLLQLPRLMTVDLSSTDWFSYARTIRPLLQHPRESVRRSASNSPAAHRELLEQSLKILSQCVNCTQREPHWELDVLAEWPVLDRVLELYHSGSLRFERFGAMSKFFETMLRFDKYIEIFYNVGLFEILCEGIESPAQLVDWNTALGSLIVSARQYSSFQLLDTSIPRTLLRCTLVPLHNRVMSQFLRLRRCGVDQDQALRQCQGVFSADERRDFDSAVFFFVLFLSDLAPKRYRDHLSGFESNATRAEFHRVVHLLFDEEQFHLGPILRMHCLVQHPLDDLLLLVGAYEAETVTEGRALKGFWTRGSGEQELIADCRRRIREDFGTPRLYLAEFCEDDEKLRHVLWETKQAHDRKVERKYSYWTGQH